MIKILNILFFLICFSLLSTKVYSQSKPDCSQYSTKTWTGLIDNMRCKRGEEVKERRKMGLPKKLGDLNPFKSKNIKNDTVQKEKVNCDDYTTKTVFGLFGKLKCKQKESK